MTDIAATSAPTHAFRHDALLYEGQQGFLARTLPFIQDGVSLGDAILVVVSSEKVALLRNELGTAADAVAFADMAGVGRNPARIIPVWREFVANGTAGGRGARGIGEPISASRSPAELVECQIHESLLNLAFRDAPAWWLVCPYDTDALPPDVIEEALHSHPSVLVDEGHRHSPRYSDAAANPLGGPVLPPPGARWAELSFERGGLGTVRAFVASHAAAFGLDDPTRVADLALVVHELAANSLRHGGGRGTLRVWPEDDALICEVRDAGKIDQPLVGRERPGVAEENGRGLWLVNQLSDLTRLRSSADGTVVRIHMSRNGV